VGNTDWSDGINTQLNGRRFGNGPTLQISVKVTKRSQFVARRPDELIPPNRGQPPQCASEQSTGPVTDAGKRRSRQNALRHGLTAETVINAVEDAEDYAAFEMAVTADYDAQSAVERELVFRLASLLWRLRRATSIESSLFKIQEVTLWRQAYQILFTQAMREA
jgi:hypothetical protein